MADVELLELCRAARYVASDETVLRDTAPFLELEATPRRHEESLTAARFDIVAAERARKLGELGCSQALKDGFGRSEALACICGSNKAQLTPTPSDSPQERGPTRSI